MKILKSNKFNDELKNILYFIALDSKSRAKIFKNNLLKSINDLIFMPYKCRKSIYFNNEDIRDLIFKGYTVVYKIDTDKNSIIILGIKKYKEKF